MKPRYSAVRKYRKKFPERLLELKDYGYLNPGKLQRRDSGVSRHAQLLSNAPAFQSRFDFLKGFEDELREAVADLNEVITPAKYRITSKLDIAFNENEQNLEKYIRDITKVLTSLLKY